MQTFFDTLAVFNAIFLTLLAFKLASANRQSKRLEVNIGKAKASICRTG